MVNREKHHSVSKEKAFLYSGEFILFLALIFLVVNSGNLDMVIRLGLPILLGAIAIILTSRFIK